MVLKHYKINIKVINWIKQLITGRSQRTVVDNEQSDECMVTSGVPQGSVIAPLLFLLYLESLIIILQSECPETHIYAFADDVKLLSSNNIELQKALNIVQDWSNKWNLTIQPKKSEHLSFTNLRNSSSTTPQFFINNHLIPTNEFVKDLGIIITNNFKWTKYLSKIASKANMLAYTIIRAFKSNNPHFYIRLFKTYALPILEYNTTIWNPTLISDTNIIENVQRKFTKRVCQRYNIKFNSYSQRLAILNIESLEQRRIKFDLINMYKIYHKIIDVEFEDFFIRNSSVSNYNTRGHNQKIFAPRYSGSTIRHNFFCNRIIPI